MRNLLLLLVWPLLTAAIPTSIKGVPWDIPSGHCNPVCTCYFEGRYHNVFDEWSTAGDPCLTYKCLQNGVIETVQKGCQFKDGCQPVDSTWTDDCQTYTCKDNGTERLYQLLETGCRDEGGLCWRVGERVTKGCDVMECQLAGGCLGFQPIRFGCEVDGECKMVGSLWHDGCTIFTCSALADGAVINKLETEVMEWPGGEYALLQTTAGCPVDVPARWSQGSWLHHGGGKNEFSVPYNLSGRHGPSALEHVFCVHEPASPAVKSGLLYQTVWQPGKYCILRSGGSCPSGFTSGYIQLDDNDLMEREAQKSGVLPDGKFGPDTGLNFCCRNDGPTSQEIVLPKERAFALFMFMDTKECQTVRGMTHTVQYFTFNDHIPGKRIHGRVIPRLSTGPAGSQLFICHYQPKECGCTDEAGTFYAVGAEKELDCVTRRCVERGQLKLLEVVAGGCPVVGGCQAEASQWSEADGERCTQHTCRRVGSGIETSFSIVNVSQGCQVGGECRDIGYSATEGCLTSTCVEPGPVYRVDQAECPWQDTCKPVNSTWQHECITYRCEMEVDGPIFKSRNLPVEFGCSYGQRCYSLGERVNGPCFRATCRLNGNKTMTFMDVDKGENSACDWRGECKAPGSVWADGCVQYRCVTSTNSSQLKWEVQTVKIECSGFQGECVPVGANVTEHCVNYTCIHTGDQVGLEATETGCQFRGGCVPENHTWTDESCVDYRCFRNRLGSGSVMQLKVLGYGCMWNNTCVRDNATWQDGCRTRKCVVTRNGRFLERSVAAISAGCDEGGVCRPEGYKKMTNSCQELECTFNRRHNDAIFRYIGAACQSEGKCHPVGTDWLEIKEKMCVKYSCHERSNIYYNEIVEQMCKDVSGQCRAVGSRGFEAVVEGAVRTNCACDKDGQGSGIRLRCTD